MAVPSLVGAEHVRNDRQHVRVSYVAATDWTKVTAIATAALASLTLILAVAAIIAAYYARRGINADRETSREAIESTYRPLLIDVTETTSAPSDLDPGPQASLSFPLGHDATVDWRHVYVGFPGDGSICVAVPLRNVGNGPAVISGDRVRVLGDGVNAYLGSSVHRERVPAGETTRILCAHWIEGRNEPRTLRVLVPYQDFAGGQWTIADVGLEQIFDSWRVRSINPAPAGTLLG